MLFSGMIPVFVFLHIFLRTLPTILFQISKTHTHFIYCPISCQISIYDFVPNFQIPLFVKNIRFFLCMSSKNTFASDLLTILILYIPCTLKSRFTHIFLINRSEFPVMVQTLYFSILQHFSCFMHAYNTIIPDVSLQSHYRIFVFYLTIGLNVFMAINPAQKKVVVAIIISKKNIF